MSLKQAFSDLHHRFRGVGKRPRGGDWLPGRIGSARVAILTIVDDEFQAVREMFNLKTRINLSRYFVRQLESSNRYDIVLQRSSDRGNTPAGEAVSDFVEDFLPSFVVVIGIAGGAVGRDNVRVGDVIVPDFVEYYEFMKLAGGKMLSRRTPYDHPSLYLRRDFAEPLRYSNWPQRISAKPPIEHWPQAIVGHIAAGEKLLDDPAHVYQKEILNMCDKALGVDMESYGVARAVFHARNSVHYNPLYLVIRGVSDAVISKPTADNAGHAAPANDEVRTQWREYAASAAAAFGFAVIGDLLNLTL